MAITDILKQNAEKLRLGSNEAALNRLAVARTGGIAQSEQQGPAREESLIEQQAKREALDQEKTLQKAGEQQQIELAAQAQELNQTKDILRRENQEKALNIRQDFQNKADAILRSRSEQRDQLSLDRNRAKAEQAAFLMRLSDDKYISNLKINGAKERLDNDVRFKEEALRSAMGNSSELFDNNFTFRKLMTIDANKFEKTLQQMSIDDAITLLNTGLGYKQEEALAQLQQTNPSEATNIANVIQGALGVATVGVEAYQKLAPGIIRDDLIKSGYSKEFLKDYSDSDILKYGGDLLNASRTTGKAIPAKEI